MLYYRYMNNINKNRIHLALGTLVILAFGAFLIPTDADAAPTNYVGGSLVTITPIETYSYQTPYQTPTPAPSYISTMQSQTVSYYPTPAQAITYNTQPRNVVTRVVTPTNNVRVVSDISSNGGSYNNSASNINTADQQDYNGLAASALLGDSGFLPTGLMQWVIVAIMIVLVVLLARRVFGASHKYHNSPLKHA